MTFEDGQNLDVFSPSPSTPSMLPPDESRHNSIDNSRERPPSDGSQHSYHSFQPMSSRSIDIPTGLSNLLDVSDEQIAGMPMGESLLDTRMEVKEDSAVEESQEGHTTAGASGTVRQKSFTSPTHPDSLTIFHSLMQSPPSDSRHESVQFPTLVPPHADNSLPLSYAISPVTQSKVAEQTMYFTPRTAPAGQESFSLDPRRTESSPPSLPPLPPVSADSSFSEAEDILSALHSEVTSHRLLSENYEDELRVAHQLTTTLQEKLGKAEARIAEYKGELSRKREVNGRLKMTIRDLERIVDEAENEKSQRSVLDECSAGAMFILQERVRIAEERLAKENEEKSRMRDELENMHSQLADFTNVSLGDIIERETPASEDKEELEALRGQAIHFERTAHEWAQREHSMIIERDTILQEKEHMEKEYAASKEKNSQLETRLAELEEAIKTSQSKDGLERDAHDAELDDAHKRATLTEERVTILQQELEAQWKNAQKAADVESELKAAVREKEDDIQSKVAAIERLEHELEVINARLIEVESNWQESEQRASDLEAELTQAMDEKTDAEDQRDQVWFIFLIISDSF
ncbi:hypothetical protein SISSUDRAFT_883747 [Sistotremastrum suecicum HHB10207 ss-3]|uniref:Uncharacterized protein n=1 Tax=Sistotremastrum suecicum HHB10207 ss-3 TaxID=1314776 RepID=A0A166C647_9AGAM|nr:hypothetical protein SISSUDRAFT_883747 [Sistotremastrum suecicum HHB10207 ss-3]